MDSNDADNQLQQDTDEEDEAENDCSIYAFDDYYPPVAQGVQIC